MSSIPPLLQRHLDDSLADAGRWLPSVVQETQEALLAGDAAMLLATRTAAADALTALQRYQPALVRGTMDELQRQLSAKPAPARQGGGLAMGDLQLVDAAQAEQDIAVLHVVQLTEHAAEWELRELQSRIATLRGERDIRASANPLRPEVVARAFWAATATLRLSPEARLLLLRAAGEPLGRALREAYARSVQRLDSWGVQPAAYRAVQLHAGPGRSHRSAAPPNSGYDVTRPGALTELMPRSAAARQRTAPPLPPRAQALRDAALDGVLARLPQDSRVSLGAPANAIRAHQAALEEAARDEADLRAVALLSQLFDRILSDATLLPAVRHRLARLQRSVLDIALHDPRLLADYNQPSWRVMNRISNHTRGYDDPADPRLAPFLGELDALLDALTSRRAQEVSQHAEALVQLEALTLKHLRMEQHSAGAAIEKLRFAQRREELQERYRAHIVAQLAGVDLRPPLRHFLSESWTQVLATSALRDGEAAPATAQYAATVDMLLSSLQPLRGAAERSSRLAELAPLVQRLQQGMALVQLPEAEREAVLGELMQRHADLLKSDGERELTPQEIVQRLREESVSGGVAGKAADSLFDVNALHTVPAELMPESAGSAAKPSWLDRAEAGTWFHLALQEGWTPARLLWVSEARRHWLFSSSAACTHSYTRRALERLAAEGLATPLEERNLLERAVDALLEDEAAGAGSEEKPDRRR